MPVVVSVGDRLVWDRLVGVWKPAPVAFLQTKCKAVLLILRCV